jgi:hypothetical protein
MKIAEANKEILNELMMGNFDLISLLSLMTYLSTASAAATVTAASAPRTATARRPHAMGAPVVAGLS